ncbi:transmembrane protein 163b-like [Diadema setosum]|uniref:transmembrane protein 163b-like n=1 Tax=Diadema setosum TaxID=31175 RepID=UPI003B3A36A6
MRKGHTSQDGHQKLERIAQFLLSVLFLTAAVVIVLKSIHKLYHRKIESSYLLIAVVATGGLMEIACSVFKIHFGRKLQSSSVLADGITSLVSGAVGLSIIPCQYISHDVPNVSLDHVIGIVEGIFMAIYGLWMLFLGISNGSTICKRRVNETHDEEFEGHR